MHSLKFRTVTAVLLSAVLLVATVAASSSADLAAARTARDHADVETLRKALDSARADAKRQNSADSYQYVAQLDLWLCEAAKVHSDDKQTKSAAQDGISAAEKAVALDSKSSEAHRLLGDLRGELIPHTFAGGMRYGKRAASELDKAIELDPKNANALIGRAIGYYFTPSTFGGSKDKAADLLKKALEIDPSSDTAHIWLARVYLEQAKHNDANREIAEALRLNPEREFAKTVQKLVLTRTR